MKYLILTRVAAFLTLVSCKHFLTPLQFDSLFRAILFGHYTLQCLYSKGQIVGLTCNLKAKAPQWITLAALFATAQFTSWLPISVYFGIHFLFSELYAKPFSKKQKTLVWRCFTNFAVYSLWVQHDPAFRPIPHQAFIALFIIGMCGLLFLVLREGRCHKDYWLVLSYEGFGALAYFLGSGKFLGLNEIIFYHLIWWFLVPIPKISSDRSKKLANYFMQSAGLTVILFLATPSGISLTGLSGISLEKLYNLSTFFGNIHITLSFALSISNPNWINQFFAGSHKPWFNSKYQLGSVVNKISFQSQKRLFDKMP